MEHDACYKRFGPCRMCDQIFLDKVRPLMNQRSKIGRDAALMGFVMMNKLFCAWHHIEVVSANLYMKIFKGPQDKSCDPLVVMELRF
jgi:hypothetical protein